MGSRFQETIDNDNLKSARNNLNDFTGKLYKKRYEREIVKMDNEKLDEIQLGFLRDNEDLGFEETRLVKKIFDYIKSL